MVNAEEKKEIDTKSFHDKKLSIKSTKSVKNEVKFKNVSESKVSVGMDIELKTSKISITNLFNNSIHKNPNEIVQNHPNSSLTFDGYGKCLKNLLKMEYSLSPIGKIKTLVKSFEKIMECINDFYNKNN
jgi:hypothetical protein